MSNLNIEALLQKAQEKARKIADKYQQKVANKIERLEEDEEPDPQEIIDHVTTKLRKQGIIPVTETVVVEKSLSYDDIIKYYQDSGLTPVRTRLWFSDDLKKDPLIRGDYLSADGKSGTPIAAICLVKASAASTDFEKQRAAFVLGPSHKWYLGPISQLIGLTCSYIQGFSSGFDGNAPGHPNCSRDFHRGYNDGSAIGKRFLEEKKIVEEVDPFENETDPAKLSELYRVGYYFDHEDIDENQKEAARDIRDNGDGNTNDSVGTQT